MECHF
jgi:hypothetical protein